MYEIALGSKADVDKAVAAAKARLRDLLADLSRGNVSRLLTKVIEIYKSRIKGHRRFRCPTRWARRCRWAEKLQAGAGLGHIVATLDVLKNYHFEEQVGTATVVREPVGVVGMITPWNWPLNQIACKVCTRARPPACTMILKPSEFTPDLGADLRGKSSMRAGVPKGVFNLVNGLGPEVGARDERAPGHRHDLVHRLDPAPASMLPRRARADRQARQPGAGRQVTERHPRRAPTSPRRSPVA